MFRHLLTTTVFLASVAALAACNTSSDSSSASAGSTAQAEQGTQRVQMSRNEVLATYTGKTLSARDHATSYKAGGTWTNDKGQSGNWTVSSGGILTMTGDINLRLEVFRVGDRFYHRNVTSGRGGYYTIG